VTGTIRRPLRREFARDPRDQSGQRLEDALIEGRRRRLLLAGGGPGERLGQTLEVPVRADLQPFDQARQLRVDTPTRLPRNHLEPVTDPFQPHLAVKQRAPLQPGRTAPVHGGPVRHTGTPDE
jgi:hypothetical protein